MLFGGSGDLVWQKRNGFTGEIAQSVAGADDGLGVWLILALGDANRAEGLVGNESGEGFVGLVVVVLAADTELDLPGQEQGGQGIAGGVFGPAKGRLVEMLKEATALDLVDLTKPVLDGDEGLVVPLDLGVRAGTALVRASNRGSWQRPTPRPDRHKPSARENAPRVEYVAAGSPPGRNRS